MKLADLQLWLVAAINDSPTLAPLGAPWPFSPFDDEATFQTTLGEALRTTGVFIEIGQAELQRTGNPDIRGHAATATFDLLIAESIATTHTPRDKALVQAIINAIHAHGDAREVPAEFQSYEAAIAEQGYILHALTFTKALTV